MVKSLEEQLGLSGNPGLAVHTPTRSGRMSLEAQLGIEESRKIRLKDLTDDQHFGVIAEHMRDKTGMTEEDSTREEIVEAYTNGMRAFNSGNSIAVGMEMDYLYRGDGEELEKRRASAGAAYELWDSVENSFAEGTTIGQRVESVKDYAMSIVLDPVNAVSLGFGAWAAKGATKTSAIALREMARKASAQAVKVAAKAGTRGAALETIRRDTVSQVMQRGLRDFSSREARAVGREQAVKRGNVANMVATGIFDAVTNVGIDAGEQKVDRMTGRAEEYDTTRGAIAAAAGVVGAGLSGALVALKGTSGLSSASQSVLKSNETMAEAAKKYTNVRYAAKNIDKKAALEAIGVQADNMREWVARGELLRMENTDEAWNVHKMQTYEHWNRGIKDILVESGLPIRVIDQKLGDRRSAWLGNLVNHKDFPDDVREAIQKFTNDTVGAVEGKSVDLNEAMATRAAFGSRAASYMNSLRVTSNLAKDGKPKKDPGNLTAEEAMEAVLNTKATDDNTKTIRQFLESAQHTFIRALVTNPATTALNVVGWSQATAMQSSADVIRGTLYGGTSVLKAMVGDSAGSSKFYNQAKLMYQLQGRKLRNLADPEGTMDEVLDYLTYRPDAQQTMFRYLVGGTDSEDVLKQLELKPGETLKRGGLEKAFKGIQAAYGVNLQDMLTKTQEFAYNMDKQIRLKYGMTWKEFMAKEDIADILTNPKTTNFTEYLKVEATAVEDSLRNVYSLKMGKEKWEKDRTLLQTTANIIEEARNIPVIGALVPFGQFFNNTISFMYDYSGANLLMSTMTGRMGKNASRDPMEVMTRAAAGWVAIGWAVHQDVELFEEGLSWDTARLRDGTPITRIYDYPLSFWKMAGRIGSHIRRDGAVPVELFEEFFQKFGGGDLVKNLGDTAGDVYGALEGLATGQTEGTTEVIQAGLAKTVEMYASGMTRMLDPINTAIAFSEGENYVEPTRAIGNKSMNNALRYTDRIFDSLIGLENMPFDASGYEVEKESAVTDRDVGVNISRLAGIRRISPASSTQKLFNDIGRPDWKTEMSIDTPVAENIFNEYVFPFLEAKANEMTDSGKWDSLSLPQKQEHLKGLLNYTRSAVKELMLNSSPGTQTNEIGLIYKINDQKNSSGRIYREVLEQFNVSEEELSGLDSTQLELILWFIQEAQSSRRNTQRDNIENPFE